MENKEFFIPCDGIRIHAKLDFPQVEQNHRQSQQVPAAATGSDASIKYPLVIVLHGFTGHMEEPHITEISSALNGHGYVTLRVDLYGHGKSDGEFGKHHFLLWISELIRIVDYARGLDFVSDLYMTGHSQGGAAVVLAGAIMQDRLRAIMPLAPALIFKDGSRSGHLLRQNFDPENLPDEVDFGEGNVLESNHFRVDRYLPFEEAAADFKKPVLLVHSPSDESVPFECSAWLQERYADSRLAVIPDDTHCFDRHLDMVIPEILGFLDEINQCNPRKV